MKKFCLLTMLVLVCFSQMVFAGEGEGDLWDNWSAGDSFYGQDKNVSDEDFDKTIEKLQEKKNKRLKKRNVPKGDEFHQSNESETLTEQTDKEGLPVVLVPVELEIDNEILPIGHYQVKIEKEDNGNISIGLYQAHFLMAKIPAIETNDDFDEETISFATWAPVDDDKIKIMAGSMDYNAYAVVRIKK